MANNNNNLNSIAVWLDQLDSAVHLDVNIWITDKSRENYIEFGIKIPHFKESGVKKVFLFLPYSFDKGLFEDKGTSLGHDEQTVSALFNEDLTVTNTDQSRFTHVKFEKDDTRCFHILNLEDDDIVFKDVPKSDGILMEIIIPQGKYTDEVKTFYSRIRINSLGELFNSYTNKSYLLSSKKETDSYIDFKVNSPRSLPRDIRSHCNGQKLERINMFLLTESNKNIVYETGEMNNARLLERHIWDSYLTVNKGDTKWPSLLTKNKKQRSDKHKIAYQWLKSFSNGEEHDYSLFVRISSASTNWTTIIIAVVFIYFLSLASEFTSAKFFTNSKTADSKVCIEKGKGLLNDELKLNSEKNKN